MLLLSVLSFKVNYQLQSDQANDIHLNAGYRLKISCLLLLTPRSGELRTQKLKSHLVRPQSLHVLPLKPGIGQYISIPATLTARDFFLANFYLSGPFTYIFSKTSPNFSRVANTGSCVGLQNEIGHPARRYTQKSVQAPRSPILKLMGARSYSRMTLDCMYGN